MEIIYKHLDQLIPYDNNPRINDDAVPKVAESIKQFGFKVPIIIDKENVIAAGHTRLLAAKQLKLDTVPCIIADDLTEDQIKAFRLADNKVSEFAKWDFDALDIELDEIDMDMSEFGFDDIYENDISIERDDISDDFKENYQIIVECENELEQEKLYLKFTNEGLKCRTSTL